MGPVPRARAGVRAGRAPQGAVHRPVPSHEREDHAGRRRRELHRVDDRALLRRARAPDRQLRHALHRDSRRDARHHIAHLRVIHPDDIHRFRELGVIANLQAFWAALEAQMVELTLPFLGEPRASWQYPFGDLHRSGAALAMGSDWAISTAARWRRSTSRSTGSFPRRTARGSRSTPCSSRAASRPRERPHRLHRRVGLREPAR